MHISGISAEILEGGTKRITITADFTRSEEIEEGDAVALMNYLRELGGEETSKPAKAEEKPKASRGRGRPKKDEAEDEEAEEVEEKKPARRGRPKKDEAEDVEDEEQEEAPRKRKARASKKDDDDTISDQDLVKACASAKEELEETFDEDTATEIIDDVLEEFGVKSVGKLDADVRAEFLTKLKEAVEFQLSDDD